MSEKIFISYRREDSAANALSISQYLEKEFGAREVFIDVDMRAGTRFPTELEARLAQCKVMLVLIGPEWLKTTDERGHRRIDDPDDWVRLEITRAITRDITVIPVCLGGTKLPQKTELPEDIRGLLDRQAVNISINGFRNEMAGLVKDIRAIRRSIPWRRFGAIPATAVLVVAAIVISVSLLYRAIVPHDQQNARQAEETFQVALSMATDDKAGSTRQLSGISQLIYFWKNHELVIATTLSALVYSPNKYGEDASSVRCAAATAIREALKPSATITDESQRKRIAQRLYGTASATNKIGSLGLITRQNYILRRQQEWQFTPNDSDAKSLGCETPLAATREAIRGGYAYLAFTNFYDNDLSYTRLDEADLEGAELNGAQLVGTDLRCANLLNANLRRTTINRFEDDKQEVTAMTDARLANIDNKLGQLPLPHTITLSSEKWHEWEKANFAISKLQDLLGTGVKVSGYPEHFCLGVLPGDNSKLVP